MRVAVVTLFPELFEPFLRTSLVGRAVESKKLEVTFENLRQHGSESTWPSTTRRTAAAPAW